MLRFGHGVKTLFAIGFFLVLTGFGSEPRFGMVVDYGSERSRSKASNEETEYSHFLPKAKEEGSRRTMQPEPQLVMSVGSRTGNQMTTWNMCDRRAVIRAARGHGNKDRDMPCFDRRGNPTQRLEQIHPMLVSYMEAYMLSCAQRAAQAAGYPQPVKLFLNISSVYVYRTIEGMSRLSQHASGRAIDIYDMSLIDREGKRTWVDTHVRSYEGPNKIFYRAFKQCWDSKLGCDEVNGSLGHQHGPGQSNAAHNDHLHLQVSSGCRGPK